MIHYTKTENLDEIGQWVREVGGQVLNKVYESLYKVTYAYRGRQSIGVKTASMTYSGLSMSSGEQRVFRILDAVFRAPNYGLILVDEIDLFLHQDALHRMLCKLREYCAATNKQLVFTTHFPPVAEMYDEMCIYTLNRVPSKTVVWRGYSYEGDAPHYRHAGASYFLLCRGRRGRTHCSEGCSAAWDSKICRVWHLRARGKCLQSLCGLVP